MFKLNHDFLILKWFEKPGLCFMQTSLGVFTKANTEKWEQSPDSLRWCRVNRDSISSLKATRIEIHISSYPCKDFAPLLSLYWLNYSTECISYMSFFSSVWTWVSIKKAARPAGSLLGFPAGSFIFHTLISHFKAPHKVRLQIKYKRTGVTLTYHCL